jgi:uncharacterized protein (TIGR02300 family)
MPPAPRRHGDHTLPDWRFSTMVKPEWGTKRTCPKCATRFYDLGKDDPVTCIDPDCGNSWMPEPVLKSKQPMPFEVTVAAPEKPEPADDDLAAEELVPDEDEEPSADDEVDLATGEDDLGVAKGDEDDEH